MKHIKLFSILSLGLLMAACAPESDKRSSSRPRGIDEHGSCSQESVNEMNKISQHIKSYDQTHDKKHYHEVKAACDKLKGLIGEYSCVALNKTTQKEENANYKDYEQVCLEAANGIL